MANVDCRISRALQSYTITYPAPDETLLATPEALPTTEPATPQIEYTIGPQHLPTVSPAGLEYTLTAILYAAGKNTDTVARTVYYRILKNGASVATGSASVAANTFYTWSHYNFLGVVPGDVLACKLWASATTVNWDYKAFVVIPTRIGSSSTSSMLVAAISISHDYWPALTLGTPLEATNVAIAPCNDDVITMLLTTNPFAERYAVSGPTWGIVRTVYGDYSVGSTIWRHATYRPQYVRGHVVTSISFRPLTLRV